MLRRLMRDRALLVGTVFILVNLLVDVAQAVLDPRGR